jgi:hypothetical protein
MFVTTSQSSLLITKLSFNKEVKEEEKKRKSV